MSERFNEQQKEFLSFMKILDNHNLLGHIVICGSWSEYIYAQSGVIPDYDITLRTLDADFLVKNLRKPTKPVSLITLVKEQGYTFDIDVMSGTTKIFSPNGLEIEFLIAQMGSGETPIFKTNLGVNAQALRHLEVLTRHAIEADFLGMKVNVPMPEAYAVHKMVINEDRSDVKREKDAAAVVNIFPYLNSDRCMEVFNRLTKKQKNRVREFLDTYSDKFNEYISIEDRIKYSAFRANVNNPTGKNKDDREISK